MGTRTERLWTIGGGLSAVLLLAVGWLFLIGPKYDEAERIGVETVEAQQRITKLERRLADLRQQNADLPKYQEQLAVQRQALPSTAAISDLLRELQAAGDRTGVLVSGVAVGNATAVASQGGTRVLSLPINLTATGPVAKLNDFLHQLQQVQPRAVLIGGVNLTATVSTSASVSINLRAFVAPTAG
jgi:Tfp pilus assembly protein PilO